MLQNVNIIGGYAGEVCFEDSIVSMAADGSTAAKLQAVGYTLTDGSTGSYGQLSLYKAGYSTQAALLRSTNDGRGNLQLFKPDGTMAVNIYAAQSSTAGGSLDICDASGVTAAYIRGNSTRLLGLNGATGNLAAYLQVSSSTSAFGLRGGDRTTYVLASHGTGDYGGYLYIYGAGGASSIALFTSGKAGILNLSDSDGNVQSLTASLIQKLKSL